MSTRLTQLWRYPVKSMGGESLATAEISVGTGIAGDRSWAVRDPVSGTIVSAKRDARILYLWSGTDDHGNVSVGVPGLADAVPVVDAGAAISAWLDRRVETVRWGKAGPDDAFDFGFPVDHAVHSFGDCGDVVHVISTGTLRYFGRLDGDAMSSGETVRRVRPNLVIDAGDEPFVEDEWIGRDICVGTARLSVLEPTLRCRIVERPQPGQAERATLLDSLTDQRQGRLGVYAAVRASGTLAAGTVVDVA
jgi:uncharacterized protein YcbX